MHRYFMTLAVSAAMLAMQSASLARPDPTPCFNSAGQPIPCKKPDLTSRSPVSIASHVTTWGAGVTLTDADALPHATGAFCAFPIKYILSNVGTGNAGPPVTATFKNVLRVDGGTVGIQSALSQAAMSGRTILFSAYLPTGVHTLTLDVDDGNAVAELNEGNNHFWLKYQLTGKCRKR